MKQKKISYIVKAKGILSSLLSKKETRIRRAIDTAIDNTEEAIEVTNSKAEEILLELGKYTEAGQSQQLANTLQTYLDLKASVRSYKEDLVELNVLKESLDTDVEIEEEEE